MKKLFLSFAVALCALIAPKAYAQGNCYPNSYDCAPCCDDSFNGFYFGGNLGVITHISHRSDLDDIVFPGSAGSFQFNTTNFTAGLQLGYDWQCNSKLVGLVFDWNWTNNRRNFNPFSSPLVEIHSRHRWFSTLRVRAGLTICDALVYVTAGAAVTRNTSRWRNETLDPVFEFRTRHGRWGWTAGAGAEYLLGCGFSLGAEFLYLNFHNRVFSTTVDSSPARFLHNDQAWLGRFLVNYRFGNLCCGF